MGARGIYHVDVRLQPNSEIIGPSGVMRYIVNMFFGNVVHGVTLKKGCTWGSTGTLIPAEGCLFAPNMFVNMGLTIL